MASFTLARPFSRRAVTLCFAAASSAVLLTGCGLINDLNPVASDKAACNKFQTLSQQIGEPIGLEGESALKYAEAIDSEVAPLATSSLGATLRNLSNSLRVMADSQLLDKFNAASEVLVFGGNVVSRCAQVLVDQ